MNELNEKELEKVSGGNESGIINPVTVTFSGNSITINSEALLKGVHIDIFYNNAHHGFYNKTTFNKNFVYENVYMTAPVTFTVEAIYPDNAKKFVSFDNPSTSFTCTF